MIDSVSPAPETLEFENIVNKLKENIFNTKMIDLFEITFAYDIKDGKMFNKTLFTDFAGLSGETPKEELFATTHQLLHIKKIYIQQARNDLLQIPHREGKSEILLSALEYIEKIIDLIILSLPFEIEKIGHRIGFTSQQVEERIRKMEAIEKDLFGGNIRENPLEVANSYRNLKTKIDKKMPTMTEEQKRICEKVLTSIKELPAFLDIEGVFKNRGKDTRKINYKKVFEDNKILFEKKINRENYVKIFELILAMYGISKAVKIDKRNSIYDGDDALYIPDSEQYSTLSIQKILGLIQHEIERHMISLKNNEENIGGFRGGYNLFMEEGSAMLMEGILAGKSLSDYAGISVSLPNLLVGELLDGDEYKKFLSIFSQKDIDRKKRLYSQYHRGVAHKDTVYTRGPKAVIEYISQGGNPKDLFLGRLQDKDIPKVKEKKNVIYPKLVSEIIIQKLINKHIDDTEFKNFIVGKYNFLTEDIIKDTTNDFTTDQKKKLIEILNIIKK